MQTVLFGWSLQPFYALGARSPLPHAPLVERPSQLSGELSHCLHSRSAFAAARIWRNSSCRRRFYRRLKSHQNRPVRHRPVFSRCEKVGLNGLRPARGVSNKETYKQTSKQTASSFGPFAFFLIFTRTPPPSSFSPPLRLVSLSPFPLSLSPFLSPSPRLSLLLFLSPRALSSLQIPLPKKREGKLKKVDTDDKRW